LNIISTDNIKNIKLY